MDPLGTFLRKNIISSELNNLALKVTHTRMITPKAKFHINDDDRFLTLYSDTVSTKRNIVLGITELPRENKITPLRIDFDFRFDSSKYSLRKTPITLDIIKQIIKFYQITIQDICDPGSFDPTFQFCILFEKEGSYRVEDGVLKDGFHLQFPHFYASAYTQDEVIRTSIIDAITEVHLFDKLHLTNGCNINTIVDKIATKSWLLYGSVKTKESKPWKVYKCYNNLLQEIDVSDIFNDELMGYSEEEIPVEYLLPRFLSIRGTDIFKETPLKPKYKKPSINYIPRRNHVAHRDPVLVKEDIKKIKEGGLIDMLSARRSEDRNMWMDVGWCLYCIGDGCNEALELWLDFSQKCPNKFDFDVCVKEWDKMQHRGKTLWSLMKMAQEDSPDEYRTWRSGIESEIMESGLRIATSCMTDYAISKLMYSMFEGQFVCSAHKEDAWYQFHSHRWHELDDAITVRHILLREVRGKLARKLEEQILADSASGEDSASKMRKKILKTLERIESTAGLSAVIKMAKTLFYNADFNKNKDEADYLFVFENGVYDLDAGIFRDGRPDDYMTMTCGHYYRNFSWDDDDVKMVELFWRKIFPDRDIYKYFHTLASSCLKGGNQLKIFPIFTGPHDGGKSISVDFICRSFGLEDGYAYIFPREFLNAKSSGSSGGPRADLYWSRSKRWAFLPELAENEDLNVGLLKAITGGDANWVRTLYQKKGEIFFPKYVPTIQCNKPPKIPSNDPATWRRMRVLDFQAKFLLDKAAVPDSLEEQFKQRKFLADPELKNNGKLDEMCEPWLWILIQHYKSYKKQGLSTPEVVTISTENYKADNDIYLQFVGDCMVETANENDVISLSAVHSEFNGWYIENYPGYGRPGKRKLRDELTKHMGNFMRKNRQFYWTKWKIQGEGGEDEINGDAPEIIVKN
jgi:phage/plasmid-associated DNA primase